MGRSIPIGRKTAIDAGFMSSKWFGVATLTLQTDSSHTSTKTCTRRDACGSFGLIVAITQGESSSRISASSQVIENDLLDMRSCPPLHDASTRAGRSSRRFFMRNTNTRACVEDLYVLIKKASSCVLESRIKKSEREAPDLGASNSIRESKIL